MVMIRFGLILRIMLRDCVRLRFTVNISLAVWLRESVRVRLEYETSLRIDVQLR